MFNFDTLVNKMDEIQLKTFAITVEINGVEYEGVFDERADEFEGVDTMYRTLELPLSNLPSPITNDETTVLLIGDSRLFTVHKHGRINDQMVLELR